MENLKEGLVTRATGSWYSLRTKEGKKLECRIRGKFRTQNIKSTNPVVVGDKVYYSFDEKNGTGFITEILDRKNYIIRKSSNLSKTSHIIAANIDQALLMITFRYPDTTTAFIDRYLITAEAYRIPVCLIFNKTDLYQQKEKDRIIDYASIYQPIGYPCHEISAKENEGLDTIRELLNNKITVISGHSGVGKSTLINALEPSLNLRINEISDYHLKGKHTTTFSEMFELSAGGFVIDTPGIKGFGIIDMEKEEIYHFFPEIFRLSKQCKYYNCIHINEPCCAVKEGIDKGLISPSRYKNYLDILNGDSKYRTENY